MASITQNPALCRVLSYLGPGLPSPTMAFTAHPPAMASKIENDERKGAAQAAPLRAQGRRRAKSTYSPSPAGFSPDSASSPADSASSASAATTDTTTSSAGVLIVTPGGTTKSLTSSES